MSIATAPDALETVIDEIESEAWKVAAEPIPARMDHLRAHVRKILEDTVEYLRLPGMLPVSEEETTLIPAGPPVKPKLRSVPEPAEPEAQPQAGPVVTPDTRAKTCKRHPGGPRLLPISEFTKDASKKGDGFRYQCRACEREQRAASRQRKAERDAIARMAG